MNEAIASYMWVGSERRRGEYGQMRTTVRSGPLRAEEHKYGTADVNLQGIISLSLFRTKMPHQSFVLSNRGLGYQHRKSITDRYWVGSYGGGNNVRFSMGKPSPNPVPL